MTYIIIPSNFNVWGLISFLAWASKPCHPHRTELVHLIRPSPLLALDTYLHIVFGQTTYILSDRKIIVSKRDRRSEDPRALADVICNPRSVSKNLIDVASRRSTTVALKRLGCLEFWTFHLQVRGCHNDCWSASILISCSVCISHLQDKKHWEGRSIQIQPICNAKGRLQAP